MVDKERLTELEFLVLNVLVAGGRSYPYRIGREVEERGGKGVVSLAGLYKALHRLEEAGYVHSAWEDIDPHEAKRPRRRLYTITGLGERALRAAARVRAAVYRPALQGI
jgi:DNA-binding PadR family transcriptional regulator